MADQWRIDPSGIRQSTILSNSGTGFVNVWQVPYVITAGPATGVSGIVQVPEGLYNDQEVAKAVQAAVDAHTSVAGL
jgi:hypothetical protein